MTTLSAGANRLASARDASRLGALPPIPASRVDPVVEDDGLLMWVRTGELEVGFDGGSLVATTGQAVWVPAGLRHWVDLSAGSVAVPLILERTAETTWPDRPAVLTLSDDWSDWILHRLSRWFGFASGFAADGAPVDLLDGLSTPTRSGALPPLPPMPRSASARAVVERLLRDPATTADLDRLAAEAHVSRRTLQRRLTAQTGASLAQWRTVARVHAAAAHLMRGRDLEWVAHRVGYATLSSFSHAFRAVAGTSPGRFAAAHRQDPDPVDLVEPHVVGGRPPGIPAAGPSPWIMPFDGVLWVLRGTAVVTVLGERRRLSRGDVIWLGQGIAHEVEVAADSIVLPLGIKAGGPPVRAGSLRVVELPTDEETELFLLHTVVSNHFLLRPPGHDDQGFLDLLHPPSTVPRELPSHVASLVSAVVDEPADRRNLSEWAVELGVDPALLRRDFVRCLGQPFAQWRAAARMTTARVLMWDGLTPTAVSRRLGYTHLSAFSKAFAGAYGMPPREWLRREAG